MESKLFALTNEAVFIPAEQDRKKISALFEALSETHGLVNFSQLPDGTFLFSGTDEKNNLTRYRLLKDRFVLSYEFCRNSINFFDARISDFYEKFMAATGIKLFLTNMVGVRKIARMENYPDGRDYMIKKVFSMKEENLIPFQRPLHLIGTRIFFPALPNDLSSFEVKIESSIEDHNALFIENLAVYASPMEPEKDKTAVSRCIQRTEKFIDENINTFLNQFGQ